MRLSDLEKVKDFTDRLTRLQAIRRILNEGPTKVRCLFGSEELILDSRPDALITIHDREFAQIVQLVRECVTRDIAEISQELRALGVTADAIPTGPASAYPTAAGASATW